MAWAWGWEPGRRGSNPAPLQPGCGAAVEPRSLAATVRQGRRPCSGSWGFADPSEGVTEARRQAPTQSVAEGRVQGLLSRDGSPQIARAPQVCGVGLAPPCPEWRERELAKGKTKNPPQCPGSWAGQMHPPWSRSDIPCVVCCAAGTPASQGWTSRGQWVGTEGHQHRWVMDRGRSGRRA